MNEIVFEYGGDKRFAVYMAAMDRLDIPRIRREEVEGGHIEMEVYDGTDVAYFIKRLCDLYGLCTLEKDSYFPGLVFSSK